METPIRSWPEIIRIEQAPPAEQTPILIAYLARKDDRENTVASFIFVSMGRVALPFLVDEAVSPGKKPDHRIRILEIIERIGIPLDVPECFTLMAGPRTRNQAVDRKILTVLAALQAAHSGPVSEKKTMQATGAVSHPDAAAGVV